MTHEEKTRVEQTIEHARFGLTNVQNTIVFVDKKIAAGITIVSVVLGLVFPKAFVWHAISTSLSRVRAIDWLVVLVLVCCAIGFLSIVLVAIHAYKTIFPRTPSLPHEWVLFPFSESDVDDKCSLYRSIEHKFAGSGMTTRDILDEFRDQLSVLGGIQAKKMIHCKAAFKWLGGFLLSMLFLLVLAFFVNGVVVL